MKLGKQIGRTFGAIVLGALVSTTAIGQVTTRLVNAGLATTSTKILPGGTASIDVRLDVGTLVAGATGLVGTGFTLTQTTPATSGFFSITARSFVGSPFNDATSGQPDATVLLPANALLDPDSNTNLGRTTVSPAVVAPAANILAVNLTLTASATTTLGTYTIAPTAGVSFAGDDKFNDYTMSGGTPYTIIVGQTLTVLKTGTGFGTVTANSGLINCGATCSDIYPGTTVILTATPNAGSTFTGWSGGGCSGTGTCTVTVNAATTVTANFTLNAPVVPPTISKVFGAASIVQGASTTLSFTINNPNAAQSLSGIGFTDTLPAGLVVATPPGVTGSCGGGTITAVAGSGVITLSGATLASTLSCTFAVNVTGTGAGVKNNVTTAVTSTEGGPGNTASASITVTGISAPVISKAFAPTSVTVGGNSVLSFTINNPNAGTTLTGVGFTDALPAGLVVATPNGLTGSCGGGAITATAGSSNITLATATLVASASCTFTVNVTATTVGAKVNVTSAVTSNEGGAGNTATATLTVNGIGAPVFGKAFGLSAIPANGSTSLTFTISNPNPATTLTGIGFTDTLPAGLIVSTPNGLVGSCGGGTITAVAGSGVVTLTGATLAANASCTFTVGVTATSLGTKNNTTTAVTSVEGGPGNVASATLTVGVLAPIPTLSQWGVLMLGLLMMVVTGITLRSRNNA